MLDVGLPGEDGFALARWLRERSGRVGIIMAHREADAFDRAIDLRITRLRRQVEIDPAHPETIRTVRGVGYMFVPSKN
jgi:DNA-binding response OmpR family regulator